MGAIQLKNVTKKFGDQMVIDDLNLSIEDGSFTVLVGPSGCGKSTTLRMITGLDEPTSGDIYIDGKKINDLTPGKRDIAMVFQNYALYPTMTVRENIEFGLENKKVPKEERKKRVQEICEVVGLTQYLDRKPATLSGGQRQRVALARAMVKQPKVFLMDEPLSNLDAKLRGQMRVELIGSKNSEGSKIYLNAQTWAVLGDVADAEKLPKILKAVDSMEHDFGFPLNLPPYQKYSPNVGRMSGMLPGLFENGGVYCHATGFKILMDCKVGRGSKAFETLKKIMPDSDKNPSMQSGAEPYVFTNCYSTNPGYYGKSYQSWTTGTSAWCMMGVYEGILGIKRDYDGLRIDPCLPKEWEKAEVTRHFRGADYHVIIENPDHLEKGVLEIKTDGAVCDMSDKADGFVLPDFKDGKMHEVHVILRK